MLCLPAAAVFRLLGVLSFLPSAVAVYLSDSDSGPCLAAVVAAVVTQMQQQEALPAVA